LSDLEIMRMDMVAGSDVALSEADDLTVFFHRRAIADFRKRNFVTRLNIGCGSDLKGLIEQLVTRQHRVLQNGNVVSFMKQERNRIEFFLSHGNKRKGRASPGQTGYEGQVAMR